MPQSPEKFFGLDVKIENRSTLANLLTAHEVMQNQLGKKLPLLYPLSLWMTTFMVSGGLTLSMEMEAPTVREELILPKNPEKQASYWLGFRPYDAHLLERALLVRITDRPQCILGIKEHPNINEIVQELRGVYDGRTVDRHELFLGIPSSDFAFGWSGPLQSRLFNVIYPTKRVNVAADFEAIFRRHKVVKELFERGSTYLSQRVMSDWTTVIALS